MTINKLIKMNFKHVIPIQKCNPNVILPTRATNNSAGLDLYSPVNFILKKSLFYLNYVII